MTVYLVHYIDTNRSYDSSGSYDLYAKQTEAVDAAIKECNTYNDHECCRDLECPLHLSLEDQKRRLLQELDSHKETLYPFSNCCIGVEGGIWKILALRIPSEK